MAGQIDEAGVSCKGEGVSPPIRTAPSHIIDFMTALECVGYRWDIATDEMLWSENATAVLGAEAMQLFSTGRAFDEYCRAAASAATGRKSLLHAPFREIGDGAAYESSYQLQLGSGPSGRLIWVVDNGRWFGGPDGRPSYALGTLHVISEVPKSSHALHGGHIDPLTGLVSRTRLMDILADHIKAVEVTRVDWALILIGIDYLGRMNDSFGFEIADQTIAQVAARLRTRVRGSDVLARFSGNKFVLLARGMDPQALPDLCEALIAHVRDTPIDTAAGPMPVSITIGAAVAPPRAITAAHMVARAQEALDRAKKRERGSVHIYERDAVRDGRRHTNLRIGEDIVKALNEKRVTIALQPVADARSRVVVFHEALARISPGPNDNPHETGSIIATAEAMGLMGVLDRRVLKLVATAMRDDPSLHLSVNVSPSSIADREWMRVFSQEVDPNIGARLVLELTESVAVHDLNAARTFVELARSMGAKVAIDDFGAGSTSFRNLRALGVDMVKIDGSFIMHMAQSADDRAFVEALIHLARQLGLRTVAEWVQDEATAKLLTDAGCDLIQGALTGLAAPM
ncbi:bifunctional diguanylate cyclase/phosphodiesterase [Xanthobacter sp. DSM 24535]|uniref:EAL domain-containing protein n=1 Tax=Roseixanthobacter psychrophilus TaxID=3119917 RepID=UPI0037293FE7